MPLESSNTIDMAVETKDGWLELAVTDSGMTSDPAQRLDLLSRKLQTYGTYVVSESFGTDHPNVDCGRVRVRVTCATPPTQEMQAINELTVPDSDGLDIPVVFENFAW